MAGMTPDSGGAFGGSSQSNAAFKKQLNKVYGFYTLGFLAFIVLVGIYIADKAKIAATSSN